MFCNNKQHEFEKFYNFIATIVKTREMENLNELYVDYDNINNLSDLIRLIFGIDYSEINYCCNSISNIENVDISVLSSNKKNSCYTYYDVNMMLVLMDFYKIIPTGKQFPVWKPLSIENYSEDVNEIFKKIMSNVEDTNVYNENIIPWINMDNNVRFWEISFTQNDAPITLNDVYKLYISCDNEHVRKQKFKDISADISLVYNNDKDEPVYGLGIANNYQVVKNNIKKYYKPCIKILNVILIPKNMINKLGLSKLFNVINNY